MASTATRLILGIMIIATILILTAPTRTIQIQARTLSALLELKSEPLAWDLTGATVCAPTLDFDSAPYAECGVGEQFVKRLDGPVTWRRDQIVSLDWRNDKLRITVLSEGTEWSVGSTLTVSSADMLRNGALAFSGNLTLGQEMSSGATGYVLAGSYSIYEQGLISSFLGWSPDITRQGDIRRGDQTRIICSNSFFHTCEGDPIEGRDGQFLNPVAASVSADHDGQDGFHVIATGTEANSLLEIAYAGRDTVLLIKPSWVQRAAASSSLLALSLLFSLMAPLLLPVLSRADGKN